MGKPKTQIAQHRNRQHVYFVQAARRKLSARWRGYAPHGSRRELFRPPVGTGGFARNPATLLPLAPSTSETPDARQIALAAYLRTRKRRILVPQLRRDPLRRSCATLAG